MAPAFWLLAAPWVVGCHREPTTGPPAQWPVGWTIGAPSEVVRGGRIVTTPPGHEEQVLGVIANAVRTWAGGCARSDVRRGPAARFRVAVSAQGVVRALDSASESPFVKCLIENGRNPPTTPTATPIPGTGVDVVVDVALDLGGRS